MYMGSDPIMVIVLWLRFHACKKVKMHVEYTLNPKPCIEKRVIILMYVWCMC